MTNANEAAVYGVDSASNGALIRDIQSILHALADLSHDITEFLDNSFHGMVGRGSKMAVRLMLAQHHVSTPCIDRAFIVDTKQFQVCGSDHTAFGYVCSQYAHRQCRETAVAKHLPVAARGIPLAMLRRFCPDHPSNTSIIS